MKVSRLFRALSRYWIQNLTPFKIALLLLSMQESQLSLSVAIAQPVAQYGQNQTASRVEVEGTLTGLHGNMMQVTSLDGKVGVFQIPTQPGAIVFKSQLKFDSLEQGMIVRVEAPALGNQFLEPFKTIDVIVPDPSKLTSKSTIVDRSMNAPGIYPLSMLSKAVPGSTPSPNVRVVGAIASVSQNQLGLRCGQAPVTLDLADSVIVNFLANSLQHARVGDKVRVTGQMNSSTGQFSPSKVEVTGAKTLANEAPVQRMVAPEGMKLKIKEKSKAKSKKEAPAPVLENPETNLVPPPDAVPSNN